MKITDWFLGTLLAVSILWGCTATEFRRAVRSVYDLGADSCQFWAASQPDGALGADPATYCSIARNAKPFVDHMLAMQKLPARGLPNVLAQPARACFVAPEIAAPVQESAP
jgi:hypothetical protein